MNANKEFIASFREANPKAKVIPRITFENGNFEQYSRFLENKDRFIEILMRRIKFNKLDGVLLEMNFVFMLDKMYVSFLEMLLKLRKEMDKEGKTLIVTLIPRIKGSKIKINKARVEEMSRFIDFFFLITYNYNISYGDRKVDSGVISPISWLKETIQSYSGKDPNLKKKFILVLK